MKYIVKRAHQGDHWYNEGDEREAREADVQHLVDRDVLEPASEKKAAAKPKNKAVESAPKNKAG